MCSQLQNQHLEYTYLSMYEKKIIMYSVIIYTVFIHEF